MDALLCFALGLLLPQSGSTIYPWTLFATWAVFTAVWGCLRPQHSRIVGCIVALCLGMSYCAWRIEARMAQALPAVWEGRMITLEGELRGLPQRKVRETRFDFHVDKIITPAAQVPERISLSDYRQDRRWPSGSRWRLTVRLKRMHGLANPYSPDMESWLLSQNRLASGNVLSAEPLPPARWALHVWLVQLRAALWTRLTRIVGNAPYGGVLIALILGEQQGISDREWLRFNHTGTTHLVSVSGVHLTLLAGLVAACALRIARRCRTHIPPRVWAALAGLLAASAYAFLAGFSVPTQRTLYMLLVGVLCLLRRDRWPLRVIWLLAGIAVLLFDPWAACTVGFWLSFGLVGAMLAADAGRVGRESYLVRWTRAQWAVSVASVVPLLFIFGSLPLASPLANAWAIPVVGSVVTPLALFATCLPFDAPLHWVLQLLQWGMWPLEVLERWPLWHIPAPSVSACAFAVLGSLLLLLPHGIYGRGVACLLLLPLLLARPERPELGSARVVVFDVGQGLAVAVETAHHVLLYDTGRPYVARLLLAYFAARGVEQLDMMVLSHDDADHSGAWRAVVDAVSTGQLLTSVPAELPQQLGASVRPQACQAGQSWQWDGVQFSMLYPDVPGRHGNDGSCVLRVASSSGASVLLTGDIERLAEAQLINELGTRLRSDILLAPHHGSGSSSSVDFIRAVAPQHVIFSAGYLNSYHHPQAKVWQRYGELDIQRWRTDRDGALLITLGAQPVIHAWRALTPHYWDAARN